MNANSILNYLSQYGVLFIFIIVFLEYLNLPGLPAGIIMPLAGLWVSRGEMNFPCINIISYCWSNWKWGFIFSGVLWRKLFIR